MQKLPVRSPRPIEANAGHCPKSSGKKRCPEEVLLEFMELLRNKTDGRLLPERALSCCWPRSRRPPKYVRLLQTAKDGGGTLGERQEKTAASCKSTRMFRKRTTGQSCLGLCSVQKANFSPSGPSSREICSNPPSPVQAEEGRMHHSFKQCMKKSGDGHHLSEGERPGSGLLFQNAFAACWTKVSETWLGDHQEKRNLDRVISTALKLKKVPGFKDTAHSPVRAETMSV